MPLSPWHLPDGLTGLWGSLAAQSGYGDGEGSPAYVVAQARARGQHFVALADPLTALSGVRWQRMLTATLASEPVLALPGFQVDLQGSKMHGIEIMAATRLPHTTDLWDWTAAEPGILVSAPVEGWSQRTRLAQDLISLYHVPPLTIGEAQVAQVAMASAWASGQRQGLSLVTPASQPTWRVGALVSTHDASGVLAALRRGRTWITSDADLGLAVQSGASWPGDLVPLRSSLPLTVFYQDDEPATLEVLLGTRIVAQLPVASSARWSLRVRPTAGGAVWARAVQTDGDVAASSPLFVEGPAHPPGLRLNEVMPAPRADWNHDGLANPDDEWIEIYNRGPDAIDLYGWQLSDEPLDQGTNTDLGQTATGDTEANASEPGDADAALAGRRWRVATSHWLEPGQFILFFRTVTRLSLSDRGDQVHLLDPQGQVVDTLRWTRSPGTNRTWARTLDGGGSWVNDMAVTLGLPNLPPTPTPTPTPRPRPARRTPTPTPAPHELGEDIAAARSDPLGSPIVVRGQVTVPPGLVGKAVFYLQAGRAGLLVELAGTEPYPSLVPGDRVQVAGRLRSVRGELRLRVSTPADLQWAGPGPILPAARLRTGAVGETWEGTLVSLRGVIVRLQGSSLWLDDGSGVARITVPAAAGFKRPRMQRGEFWAVTGIVSQYGLRAPFNDGYRVLVREASDLTGGRAMAGVRAPEGVARPGSSRAAQPKPALPPRPAARPWRPAPHWLE